MRYWERRALSANYSFIVGDYQIHHLNRYDQHIIPLSTNRRSILIFMATEVCCFMSFYSRPNRTAYRFDAILQQLVATPQNLFQIFIHAASGILNIDIIAMQSNAEVSLTK